MTALRALLAGIVDYAGLFPPAALDMPSAVRNYAAYRRDAAAWMLGRFVVPVARLDEFAAERSSTDDDGAWKLSALVGSDAESDIACALAFNHRESGRAVVDSLEARLAGADAIARVAAAAAGRFDLFIELPLDSDLASLVAAVARAGAHAKVRTGGVVASAIPPAADVVRFIRACLDAGVSFKATAGLHHPLRAEYRLTYEPDSPSGVMYGYLNIFLASALMAEGLGDADALSLLEERDPAAFSFAGDRIAWRGRALTAASVERARRGVALSFGSCSFREPVDELHLVGTA